MLMRQLSGDQTYRQGAALGHCSEIDSAESIGLARPAQLEGFVDRRKLSGASQPPRSA